MNVHDPLCPLCGRPLGTKHNKHHLIPKSRGGKETVDLHIICHNKIHSVFTEKELADQYFTIEALATHEEIANFIRWVRKRPPEFNDRNIAHRRKRR